MQPDDPLNDAALERELRRALSVDPSPEFVARVRMRVANEPAGTPWRASWMFAAIAVAAAIIAAIVVQRGSGGRSPGAATPLLAARGATPSVGTLPAVGSHGAIPYVVSAFRRTMPNARGSTGSPRAVPGSARPELFEGRVLLDPRETEALRALISGVRRGRLDLTPVLRASTPTAMDLPAIQDIDIPVITIEPLAPFGAEGVRQ